VAGIVRIAMEKPSKWTLVEERHDEKSVETRRTARMRVRGGYLYRVEVEAPHGLNSRQTALALAFVPKLTNRSRSR
jgi:hypothetical protein